MPKPANNIKKILIIALSGAGDVLMSTPLIRELRLNYPKAEIDCLVMQGRVASDVLITNKDLSKVIYFNFMKEGVIKSLSFCKKMRKENYDLSITVYPQARYEYSIVSWLIGAKRRIGFNYDSQSLKLNRLFFTDILEENFVEHVVMNNLKVLSLLGLRRKVKNPSLILNLGKSNINFANSFFTKNKIKKAVAIHAGSGTTKNFILKRWSRDKFASLASTLNREKGYKIILLGGPDEQELKNYIIKKSNLLENKEIFNLNTDILNTSAIIEKCKLLITNDTIMGHIAAAVGTKVIGLFGLSEEKNTGPFTKNKIIICKRPRSVAPFKHGGRITREQASCMDKIEVNDVLGAIK
jgi:lipopolysaccharide heptosyltransferase II